jgi:hypothetical protein
MPNSRLFPLLKGGSIQFWITCIHEATAWLDESNEFDCLLILCHTWSRSCISAHDFISRLLHKILTSGLFNCRTAIGPLEDPVQANILKSCKIADNKANANDKRVSDSTYDDFRRMVLSREDTTKIISD